MDHIQGCYLTVARSTLFASIGDQISKQVAQTGALLDSSSLSCKSGSEIAPSWSPMRLKIEYWRPEFHSWSPVGDLLLSSEPFANKCLTFYPADVFEIKMKGVFLLTTFIGLHNVASRHVFLRFLIKFIKYLLRAKKLRLSREI